MKRQAYDLQKRKQAAKEIGFWYEDIPWCQEVEAKHKKICQQIRYYQFQLGYYKRTGAYSCQLHRQTSRTGQNSVTDSLVMAAKEQPISNYYPYIFKRFGSRLVGRCPFHQEKTGSFVIFSSNRWYCFGCHEHGDSIDFISRLQKLNFVDSVKYLTM